MDYRKNRIWTFTNNTNSRFRFLESIGFHQIGVSMFTCKGTFRGGYYFKNFKGTPKFEILDMGIPKSVVIPFQQGFGEAVEPVVKVGEQVKAGQIIAQKEESLSSPIHSTVNGTVKEIKEIPYRGKNVLAAFIESDGSEGHLSVPGARSEIDSLSAQEIGDMLYLGGVSGLGNSGIPTHRKSALLSPEEVKYLLISALETHPFALSPSVLCERKFSQVAGGIRLFRTLYPQAEIVVGACKSDKAFAKSLAPLLVGIDNVRIVSLKPKYPQESPEILAETLAGKKVPDGKSPDSIGAVVLEIGAVLAAFETVAEGKPLISKLIGLGGTGYKQNAAIRIRIGTLAEEILSKWGKENVEKRFLLGNALTGDEAASSTPVGREIGTTTCLEEDRKRQFMFFLRPGTDADSYSNAFASGLLPIEKKLTTNLNGEHRPCIQCSYCEDVCPRPLLPYLLSKYCAHDMAEEALQIRMMGCIECGLCAYVCPSKIPLMADIQKGKAAIGQN